MTGRNTAKPSPKPSPKPFQGAPEAKAQGAQSLDAQSPDAQFPWTAVWVGLVVRIAYMTLARTWRMRPYDHHFAFGYEMGRIARALATGYGYADPFRGHTGPTAWVPPLYPWILAGDFRLFGVYSALSAWIILAFDCLLNALIVLAVWEIAARCFNRKVAWWSAWVWALYPAAMQYAVKSVWEMTLTTFLFSWVLVLTLRMRRVGDSAVSTKPNPGPTLKRWALFGLLWGLIALSNPALCLFLPISGLWILLAPESEPQGNRVPHVSILRHGIKQICLPHISPLKDLKGPILAALIFLACLAPWTWRDGRVFHHFIPLRDNLGVELYLGNGPGATGLLMEYDHPFQAPDQLRLYRQMGEYPYSRWRGDLAKRIILAHPARFLLLSLKRAYYFWFSVPHPGDEGFINEYGRNLNFQFTSIVGLFGLALALRRRVPAAWLFFWAFLLLPLTYYAVTVHARFRHPLEPLIAILAVYLFQSAEKSREVRWFRRRVSPTS